MIPTISVIIPVHNRAVMVRQAIRSVQAQSGSDVELLVVDDGSTDGTAKRIRNHFPDLPVIRQDHRGVSAARNRGILKSSGEFIAFLDSDDLFLPPKCRAQAEFLQQHPELLLVHSDEHWLRDKKFLKQGLEYRREGGDQFERSLEKCVISPSSVMLRRELLDEVGLFDESMPACEDYDLWLRVTSRHPVGYIPHPLLIKRGGHPDQLSRTVPALDYWRIRALLNLLRDDTLPEHRVDPLVKELTRKCEIFAAGRDRRGFADGSLFRAIPKRCRTGTVPEFPTLPIV